MISVPVEATLTNTDALRASILAATACGSRLETGELQAANGVLTKGSNAAGAVGGNGASPTAPGGWAANRSPAQMLALARALVKDPAVFVGEPGRCASGAIFERYLSGEA